MKKSSKKSGKKLMKVPAQPLVQNLLNAEPDKQLLDLNNRASKTSELIIGTSHQISQSNIPLNQIQIESFEEPLVKEENKDLLSKKPSISLSNKPFLQTTPAKQPEVFEPQRLQSQQKSTIKITSSDQDKMSQSNQQAYTKQDSSVFKGLETAGNIKGLQIIKIDQKDDQIQNTEKAFLNQFDPEEESLKKSSNNANSEKPLSPKIMIQDKFDFDVKYDTMHSLAMMCKNLARFYKKISKVLNSFYQKIDQKGENLFQKIRQNQKWKNFSSFLFICICFFIVWIIYVGLTSKSRSITKPDSFDNVKQFISNNLIAGSFIFTIYGIIFLHIKSYVILILLFLLQALPTVFVFLSNYYQTIVNSKNDLVVPEPQYFQAIFTFGLYIFWLIAYLMKEDIQEQFNSKVRNLFLVLWCIIPGAILIGYTMYSMSTTWELNFQWGYDLINVLAAPYILMLILIWIYMHFRYFYPLLHSFTQQSPNNLQQSQIQSQPESPLMHQQQQLMSQPQQLSQQEHLQLVDTTERQAVYAQKLQQNENAPLQQNQNQYQQSSNKKKASEFKQRFENYVIIFSSCVYGGSLITLTVLSILYIAHSLSLGQMKTFINPKGFYLSVFFVASVPAFILIGTALVLSKVKEKTKFILIPILGALIPMCFSMPMSVVIDDFKDVRPLRRFFMLGPSCTTLYWITLIWIRINHQKLSMLINSYVCLFFIIPIFYIIPLRNQDTYDKQDEVSSYFEYILIFMGISLIILLILADLLITYIQTWRQHLNRHKLQGRQVEELEDEFTRSERFELANVFKYDLANFGLWGNSFGYILTTTILMFMYYSQPDWIKPYQSGTLVGLQIVIVFLFLYSLIILLLRIIPLKQKQVFSFSEMLIQKMESKKDRDIIICIQRRVKRAVMRFSHLESPILFCLLLAIYWKDEEMRWNCVVAAVGIMVVSWIFAIFFSIKQKFEDYSKTAIPALIVFLWIFIYLPFLGILPSSLIYLSNDDEDMVNYERTVYGFTALLLMVGVSLILILGHLFFRRRDFEQKLKYISSKAIKKLAKNHVKSDYISLSLVYQGYITFGEDNLKQQMIANSTPIYWTSVSKYNPDMRFSKMLIDAEAYQKLKSRKKKAQSELLERFLDCFFYYYCCLRDDMYKKRRQVSSISDNFVDDSDLDLEDKLEKMQDEARHDNIKKMQEEEEEIEEDLPWMKQYLLNINMRWVDGRIIEALRRYDLPQNLQISKPWTTKFLKDLFELFAQGSQKKFAMPWIDYSMFKQMMVLSHLVPCKELADEVIDKVYGKYTAFERVANQNPITEDRFLGVLQKIGQLKYPYDPPDEVVGRIVKFWLFPYLLWYVQPLHGMYPHEWDYVLFLLKLHGLDKDYVDTMKSDIDHRKDLEKFLGILPLELQNQQQPLLEIDDRSCTIRRIKKDLIKCCKLFGDNLIYFLKSYCLLEKEQRNQGVDEIDLEVNMVNNTLLKPVPFANKRKKVYHHEESPEWPQLVDMAVDELIDQEKAYMKMKDQEFVHLRLKNNITNKLAIIFKILEIFILGSLAFRPIVDWNISKGGQFIINILNSESPSTSYSGMFTIMFIIMIGYMVVAYKSVMRIRDLTYGSSEARMRRRHIFSIDFAYVQILNGLSMCLSFFVIKIFIDSIACDYAIRPQTLYQDSSLHCFSPSHRSMLGLSILGIFIFYPTLVLLWPNIQYQNKSLDLKYNPTYLVVQGNVKFLIAGSAAFFGHKDVVVCMLGFNSVVLLGFAILTRKMKPCLLKKVNPLEMGGYFVAGWMNISGIVVQLVNKQLGLICLFIGLALIAVISIGFFKIINDKLKDSKKKKVKKVVNENGEEVEILVSDNEDSEEEEQKKHEKQKESLEYKVWKGLNEFKIMKEQKNEWPADLEEQSKLKQQQQLLLQQQQQEGEQPNNNQNPAEQQANNQQQPIGQEEDKLSQAKGQENNVLIDKSQPNQEVLPTQQLQIIQLSQPQPQPQTIQTQQQGRSSLSQSSQKESGVKSKLIKK